MGFLTAGVRHRVGRWIAIATVATGLFACAPDRESAPDDAPARLVVDRAAGRIEATRGDLRRVAAPDDSTWAALDALARALDRGETARDLRLRLGRELLGPLEDVLRTAPRWIARTTQGDPLPGPLATLSTWILPWKNGDPVVAHHATRLDWPLVHAALAGVPRVGDGEDVLVVAPFHDGVDPARDDPDTLRTALRAAAAGVEALPRNDVGPVRVRRALEQGSIALIWLRATPDAVASLRGAFGAFPPLVAWSLPAGADSVSVQLIPNQFTSGGESPAVVLFPVRAAPEREVARLARIWVDGLARGESADVALRAARDRLRQGGAGPAVWSALAVVGDRGPNPAPRRAPWLRRALARDPE